MENTKEKFCRSQFLAISTACVVVVIASLFFLVADKLIGFIVKLLLGVS